jgi:hypothetical protein
VTFLRWTNGREMNDMQKWREGEREKKAESFNMEEVLTGPYCRVRSSNCKCNVHLPPLGTV